MTESEAVKFIEHLIFEKRKNMSEVAEEIGINRATIAEILCRKRKLSMITIRKIDWYRKKISDKP